MILASNRAAPLRFLIAVVLCWTLARAAMLAGWRPAPFRTLAWGPALGSLLDDWPWRRGVAIAAPAPLPALAAARPGGEARRRTAMREPLPAVAPAPLDTDADAPLVLPADAPDDRPLAPGAPEPRIAPPVSDPGGGQPASMSRLQGSGWLFLRGGSGAVTPLSPQGRIGGGQAGVRLLYAIDAAARIGASARLSRAVDGPRQTEAAIGLDVRPLATPALHLTIERRIAIDRGGRDAWAAGVAGGVFAVALLPATRLDGYGQAGIVGARRRDLYADGAMRIGREVRAGDRASLTVGGGTWGAAQPGAARLDIGPSAVLRVPVGPTTLAAALDYRKRVAGDARPGSGPAFTLGVDF